MHSDSSPMTLWFPRLEQQSRSLYTLQTSYSLSQLPMSTSAFAPLETDVPVFDVVVSLATGATADSVEQLARQYGDLPSARIDGFVRALRNNPRVKIGDHIPQERVDVAREQFTKLGLTVNVVPVLSLQTKSDLDADGRFLCRACNNRVDLPSNRQCPKCGVFVDKITDEFLLRKKIMDQERAKLDYANRKSEAENSKFNTRSMEEAIRRQIREELEAEMGLSKKGGLFSGGAGWARLAGLLLLVIAAFFGGRFLPAGKWSNMLGTKASVAANDGAKADVDKMLNTVAPAGSGDAREAAQGQSGDSDIDDPMIQSLTGGKKMGGKGLTMEQAIAASKTLAGAVGNTTADRAMNGSSASGAPGASAEPTVNPATKQILSADFAKQLAELGQWRRAREVIKATKPLAVDALAKVALRQADLESRAWATRGESAGSARQTMDDSMADLGTITDAVERSVLAARVGVILSQNERLPPEAARAFLTFGADALKTVGDAAQRARAMTEWQVATGQVIQSEVAANAKAGRTAKAQSVAEQLEPLIKGANDLGALALLHTSAYKTSTNLGQSAKATDNLELAIALATKIAAPIERATVLRQVAQSIGSATHRSLQAAVASLRSQISAAPSPANAAALVQLALLYADFGLLEKSEEIAVQARATKGLAGAAVLQVQTDLLVRSGLAEAKLLHRDAQYAAAEAAMERVGGYLF